MKLNKRLKIQLMRWMKQRKSHGWEEDFRDILGDLSGRVKDEAQFNKIIKSVMSDTACNSISKLRQLINHRLTNKTMIQILCDKCKEVVVDDNVGVIATMHPRTAKAVKEVKDGKSPSEEQEKKNYQLCTKCFHLNNDLIK